MRPPVVIEPIRRRRVRARSRLRCDYRMGEHTLVPITLTEAVAETVNLIYGNIDADDVETSTCATPGASRRPAKRRFVKYPSAGCSPEEHLAREPGAALA
jgi:hypothetical protein